ncbi:MAG: YdiU family protein [Gammaproteobacteria bacterium]|nr:YdiU family protein [Gammaproteobacteria bacterium]MBU2057487.1 YdiU family protein [Gammaproteobacteria bacterium]MBU2176247.1 YdiU family protein [Gammaproteobacteria bacterium]MBU2245848.1 YdiU family protein [Gammaproteobacteria bacterium]MBU2343122.1 YdiU family protein [Gammaproteobacteria bacterium]
MSLILSSTYATHLPDLVSAVAVTPFAEPRLLAFSSDTAALLQLPTAFFSQTDAADYLSGKKLFAGSTPVAQKYAGHQFGHYNPELGDGRGLLLGDIQGSDGLRYDLHLKGAGRTPYSRFGDGRAVLRSSIREFLASEAMHHLGIPTSRALSLVGSSEPVQRETIEQGAMVIRLCPSHIRFGHFEHCFYTGDKNQLQRLVDFTVQQHFPDCLNTENPALAMLQQVVVRTAELISQWQAVGFNHGVMNTDNMSILGLSFDYGPYAFLDDYQPGYICNHSDHSGRYAFDEQPGIGLWNLNALAHALSPLIEVEDLRSALGLYEPALVNHYMTLMGKKLGLSTQQPADRALVGQWLALLQQQQQDYSLSFRRLADFTDDATGSSVRDHMLDVAAFDQWAELYRARLALEPASAIERKSQMNSINPLYILRNYLAQQVISAAEQGDTAPLHELMQLLQNPYQLQAGKEAFAAPPPDWGKGMDISCSS